MTRSGKTHLLRARDAAFISYLDHHEYTREQRREKLNEVERENTKAHGYGW